MKKVGIRILLVLVLVSALILGSFSTVSAARPESRINVISISEDNIEIQYGWDNIRVYSYSVYIFESGTTAYYFENFNLGTLTKNKTNTTVSVTNTGIDEGDQIHLRLWLYNHRGKKMKHFSVDMNVTVPITA